jgi:hypothetical protein
MGITESYMMVVFQNGYDEGYLNVDEVFFRLIADHLHSKMAERERSILDESDPKTLALIVTVELDRFTLAWEGEGPIAERKEAVLGEVGPQETELNPHRLNFRLCRMAASAAFSSA